MASDFNNASRVERGFRAINHQEGAEPRPGSNAQSSQAFSTMQTKGGYEDEVLYDEYRTLDANEPGVDVGIRHGICSADDDYECDDSSHDIEEVDTANDQLYFISAGSGSFAGYMASHGEDDHPCVICQYVNSEHHREHYPQPSDPSQKASQGLPELSSEHSPAFATSSTVPKKRPSSGLELSKHNPARNVRPRLERLGGNAVTTGTCINRPSDGIDGALNTSKTGESDCEPSKLKDTADKTTVISLAEKAGTLVSDLESDPTKARQMAPLTPASTSSEHKQDDEVGQNAEDEDHHSLDARIKRNADTSSLVQGLARMPDPNNPSHRTQQRRAFKRSACADCRDDILATPLLFDQDMPCPHVSPTKPIRRSAYKIQKCGQSSTMATAIKAEVNQSTRGRLGSSWRPATWCYCGKPYTGKAMYRCCNEQCLVGWYHERCLRQTRNDTRAPWRTGIWYCDVCISIDIRVETSGKHGALNLTKEDIMDAFRPQYWKSPARGDVSAVYGFQTKGISESDDNGSSTKPN